VTATQTPHWFPLECTPLTLICGEKISLGVAYLLLAKIVNVLRSAKMHEESLPHGASMLLSNNGRDFRSDGEPFAEADSSGSLRGRWRRRKSCADEMMSLQAGSKTIFANAQGKPASLAQLPWNTRSIGQ
jgi:hypothetical protein